MSVGSPEVVRQFQSSLVVVVRQSNNGDSQADDC
jgi:hypothetical protein